MIIRFIQKIYQRIKQRSVADPTHTRPQDGLVVPRNQHTLSRSNISKNALTVLNRLHQAGFQAYLVGGSVRDLLLNLKPKDFDIATDAHPEEVRRLFRNSRLIGRRFRLVHVFFGLDIVEVATFRKGHPEDAHPEGRQSATGMLIRDNIYGSMADDAWRRDFTINALYYNIADYSIVDYTGGLADLKQHRITILGDPIARYKEDPVRMLRALRLTAKLDFTMDAATAAPIQELKTLIKNVSPARLFDEVLKLFYCGHGMRAYRLLHHYGLFAFLFSQTEKALSAEELRKEQFLALLLQSFKNTDARLANGQSLNPAFLFAVLLWPPLQLSVQRLEDEGNAPYVALEMAMKKVLAAQQQEIAIPKRYTLIMMEIWTMQFPLQVRNKKYIKTLFASPRFRAAFDFLVLRMESGEAQLKSAVDWWQHFQTATPQQRHKIAHQLTNPKKKTLVMHHAFVGLGSNLEQPIEQIKTAISALMQLPKTRIHAASSLYQTAPQGCSDQPDYINAVVELRTRLSLEELFAHLQILETHQGRHRDGSKNQPRTLDLDLLLFDQEILDSPELTIPHPRMNERGFVLIPLLEIAPKLCLPDGVAIHELLEKLPDECKHFTLV